MTLQEFHAVLQIEGADRLPYGRGSETSGSETSGSIRLLTAVAARLNGSQEAGGRGWETNGPPEAVGCMIVDGQEAKR